MTAAGLERQGGPSAARVYDYLAGGWSALAADRDLAEKMAAECPELRDLARVTRRFDLAAATWAAGQGVRQVADLGAGLPVAYADEDPAGVAVIGADVSDPAAVLADLGGPLDLAAPVLLLLGGTLSCMEAGTARNAVAEYAAALVPGSLIAISCASWRDKEAGDRMAALHSPAGPWVNHSRADIESFFAAAGLRIIHGRVMDLGCWPTCPVDAPAADAQVLGGIGVTQ